MASAEKPDVFVKGQPVPKRALVDVAWLEDSPMGKRKRMHVVSLVHEVGRLEGVAGILITGRDGRPTPVLTQDITDFRIIRS